MQNVMMVHDGSDGRECVQDTWYLQPRCVRLPGSLLPVSAYQSLLCPHRHRSKFEVWTQIEPDTLHWCLSHSSAQAGSYFFIYGEHDGAEYTPELHLIDLTSVSAFSASPRGEGSHTAVPGLFRRCCRIYCNGMRQGLKRVVLI